MSNEAKRLEMIDYLPRYYIDFPLATNVIERGADEITSLDTATQDVLNQFFVDTTTWGLAIWEKNCGISVDESKPLDQRRSVIKSKLRSKGVVSVALIKNVSESYANGEVEVIEDDANYSFTIRFVGLKGIPPNMDDLKGAIDEIKPAHLIVNYEYTYLTWDEFDRYNKTWDAWDTLSLTWDEFEIYKEVM